MARDKGGGGLCVWGGVLSGAGNYNVQAVGESEAAGFEKWKIEGTERERERVWGEKPQRNPGTLRISDTAFELYLHV